MRVVGKDERDYKKVGKGKTMMCKYDKCPYRELDEFETYEDYFKSQGTDLTGLLEEGMQMRLTKFNPETGEYEYIEPAKTQAEFNAQRKAVIQRLGEFEDKASDVAEEIFAEIENTAHAAIILLKFEKDEKLRNTKTECYEDLLGYVAELKKKYIGKDTNVTTKYTEEGK